MAKAKALLQQAGVTLPVKWAERLRIGVHGVPARDCRFLTCCGRE